MTPREEVIVQTICERTRPLVQQRYSSRLTCILSTAIARDVLAYFDIASEPVPVTLIVGNAAWAEWMDRGRPNPQPADSYALGTEWQERRPDGWPGHLVLRVGGVGGGMLDADLGGWSRPQHGIDLPPGGFFSGGTAGYLLPGGSVVIYASRVDHPLSDSWRAAPDWRYRGRRKAIVGRLVRECRAALA